MQPKVLKHQSPQTQPFELPRSMASQDLGFGSSWGNEEPEAELPASAR